MKNLNSELSNIDIISTIRGRGLRFSIFYETEDNLSFSQKLLNSLKHKHKILLDIKWHRAGFRPSFLVDKKTADFVIDKFVLEIKNILKKTKFKKIYF